MRRVRSERRLRFEASAVVLGLLGIVAVTVLVIAAWQFSGGGAEGGGDIEPAPAEAAVAPAEAGPPEAPAPSPSPQPPAPAAPQPSVESAPEFATLEIAAVSRKSRVTVRRNGRSGRVLFAETLARGESRTFEGLRLHAAFRNPNAVSVRVNGEELSAVPRRLLATADGWRQE